MSHLIHSVLILDGITSKQTTDYMCFCIVCDKDFSDYNCWKCSKKPPKPNIHKGVLEVFKLEI